MSHTVFRQRLTHFLKILEIFKIPKFFDELCQNLQFLVKIIFKVTLVFCQYDDDGADKPRTKKSGKCSQKLARQRLTRQRLTHFSSFEHY